MISSFQYQYYYTCVSQEQNSDDESYHFKEESCMSPNDRVPKNIETNISETSSAKCHQSQTLKEPKKGFLNRVHLVFNRFFLSKL